MNGPTRYAVLGFVALLLVLALPAVATAATDSITIGVAPQSVTGAGTFTVSGTVTAASGNVTGTAVLVTVQNPSQTDVAAQSAPVVGTGPSGTYSKTITAGGGSNWVNGTYKVTVTYGTSTSSAPATATATFAYSPTATTTTTATTQTVTQTVTSTVTSSVTSTSVSTTTVTSTSTTTSTSVQTSTVTSTTTSTTTTSALVLSNDEVIVGGIAFIVLIIALVGIALIRRR